MSLAETFDLYGTDPAEMVAAAEVDPGELLARWIDRPAWMDRAACRGENVATFFTQRGGRTDLARAICATCPVHAVCLRYALDDPDLDGIWAATTTRERRAIRRAAA